MALLKTFISGPDAALHLASIVEPLIANHSGVKCVVDSNGDAVLVKDVTLLMRLLDMEHPVGHLIVSACVSHQKQHGSGVKTLLCFIRLFTKTVVNLREQGVPLTKILTLMRAAIQECVLVCEESKIAIAISDMSSRQTRESDTEYPSSHFNPSDTEYTSRSSHFNPSDTEYTSRSSHFNPSDTEYTSSHFNPSDTEYTSRSSHFKPTPVQSGVTDSTLNHNKIFLSAKCSEKHDDHSLASTKCHQRDDNIILSPKCPEIVGESPASDDSFVQSYFQNKPVTCHFERGEEETEAAAVGAAADDDDDDVAWFFEDLSDADSDSGLGGKMEDKENVKSLFPLNKHLDVQTTNPHDAKQSDSDLNKHLDVQITNPHDAKQSDSDLNKHLDVQITNPHDAKQSDSDLNKHLDVQTPNPHNAKQSDSDLNKHLDVQITNLHDAKQSDSDLNKHLDVQITNPHDAKQSDSDLNKHLDVQTPNLHNAKQSDSDLNKHLDVQITNPHDAKQSDSDLNKHLDVQITNPHDAKQSDSDLNKHLDVQITNLHDAKQSDSDLNKHLDVQITNPHDAKQSDSDLNKHLDVQITNPHDAKQPDSDLNKHLDVQITNPHDAKQSDSDLNKHLDVQITNPHDAKQPDSDLNKHLDVQITNPHDAKQPDSDLNKHLDVQITNPHDAKHSDSDLNKHLDVQITNPHDAKQSDSDLNKHLDVQTPNPHDAIQSDSDLNKHLDVQITNPHDAKQSDSDFDDCFEELLIDSTAKTCKPYKYQAENVGCMINSNRKDLGFVVCGFKDCLEHVDNKSNNLLKISSQLDRDDEVDLMSSRYSDNTSINPNVVEDRDDEVDLMSSRYSDNTSINPNVVEDRDDEVDLMSSRYSDNTSINSNVVEEMLKNNSGDHSNITHRNVNKSDSNGDRNVNKSDSNGDRNVNKSDSNGDRNVNKSDSNGDRNVNKSDSNGDRNVNKSDSNGDRNVNKSDSNGDRNVNKSDSNGDRNVNKSDSNGDRNVNKSNSNGDRNVNKSDSNEVLDLQKLNEMLKTFKSESYCVNSKMIMNCSRHFKTVSSSVEGLRGFKTVSSSVEGLRGFKTVSSSVEGLRGFKTVSSSVEGLRGLQLTGSGAEAVGMKRGTPASSQVLEQDVEYRDFSDLFLPEHINLDNQATSDIKTNNKINECSLSSEVSYTENTISDITQNKMDKCPISSEVSYTENTISDITQNKMDECPISSVITEPELHASLSHLLKLGKTVQERKKHAGLSQSRHFREFCHSPVLDSRGSKISSNLKPFSQNPSAILYACSQTMSEQNIPCNQVDQQTEEFSLSCDVQSLNTNQASSLEVEQTDLYNKEEFSLSCEVEQTALYNKEQLSQTCFKTDEISRSQDDVAFHQQNFTSDDYPGFKAYASLDDLRCVSDDPGFKADASLDDTRCVSDDRSFKRHATLTVDEVGRGLCHGLHETMEFVLQVFHNQQGMRQNKQQFNLKLIHACVVEGSFQHSRLTDGLVLLADWQQLDNIHRKSQSSTNVLLVNGDVSLTFRHTGFKSAAPVSTVVNKISLQSESDMDEFVSECIAVLKQFSIDMVLSRGKVDSVIKEAMMSYGVVVMEMVPYHALEVLQVSTGVNYVTYVSETTQRNVCSVFIDVLHLDWMDRKYSREQLCWISIRDPHRIVQTFVCCHPCKQAGELWEQEFWACANRLSSALTDGAVLPGAGWLEVECASHLMSLANKQLGSMNGENFYTLVCQSVANCFLNFSQTIKKNLGQDHTKDETRTKSGQTDRHRIEDNTDVNVSHTDSFRGYDSFPHKFYDNFQTKLAAWRCALDTVSVIVQTDALVITGISHSDTFHPDSVLF